MNLPFLSCHYSRLTTLGSEVPDEVRYLRVIDLGVYVCVHIHGREDKSAHMFMYVLRPEENIKRHPRELCTLYLRQGPLAWSSSTNKFAG